MAISLFLLRFGGSNIKIFFVVFSTTRMVGVRMVESTMDDEWGQEILSQIETDKHV
jgi:hypothetical protein